MVFLLTKFAPDPPLLPRLLMNVNKKMVFLMKASLRLCLKYIYVSCHGLKYTFNASFQNVLCEMFFLIVTVSLHYICSRDDRSCNCNINGTNMENSAVSLGTLVIMLTLIMFSTNEQKLHASNRVRFYCIAVSMLYRQATDR